MMFKIAVAALIASVANAECPNACSGHGSCSNFDMCTCYRNFGGNDCSLRTCPYDNAHVDSPKGDLDSSNGLNTTEKFHVVQDTYNTTVAQSAHSYMECSNKGICDRKKGECECFEGYEGTACQRASCPNSCSGHGTCETIAELAFDDFETVYALWDKDASMGCKCDPGYSGSDCADRMCKYGIDPLYADDTSIRVQETKVRFESSVASTLYGTYSLKFYDVFGEDYDTKPIVVASTKGSGTTEACVLIKAALEGLPNDVIEEVGCTASDVGTNQGFEASIVFKTNPGVLKQLEIDSSNVGVYASATPTNAVSGTVTASVYQMGVTGQFIDYFANKCQGVVLKSLDASDKEPGSIGYLSELTAAEEKLLKACLGDSDGDASNNVDVENWDTGALPGLGISDFMLSSYPHAIMTVHTDATKVQETTVSSDAYLKSFTAGDFNLIWYDTSKSQFRAVSRSSDSHVLEVHTTDGVVQMLATDPAGGTQDDKITKAQLNETKVVGMFHQYSNTIYTNIDVSCESGASTLHTCLDKGDKLFVIDGCWGDGREAGPGGYFAADSVGPTCTGGAAIGTTNLYTVNRIYTRPYSANTTEYWQGHVTAAKFQGIEDRYVIVVDQNIPWDGWHLGDTETTHGGGGRHSGIVVLFKFTPAATGNYEYVSQCSGRGTCNSEEGLCECFKGYHGDACHKQSSLAN